MNQSLITADYLIAFRTVFDLRLNKSLTIKLKTFLWFWDTQTHLIFVWFTFVRNLKGNTDNEKMHFSTVTI